MERIKLPEPQYDSDVSIEKALFQRRSIRNYTQEPLTVAEISQLLWAAQGITNPHGFRTAPSAGALYPLEIYIAAGKVRKLPPGIYKYKPHGHELIKVVEGDKRKELYLAALSQNAVNEAPVVFVFSAVYDRMTRKYGERGINYVHMESGCAVQNVYLQAVSLGLKTVVIGAFYDNKVKTILNSESDEQPLCIMPVGK